LATIARANPADAWTRSAVFTAARRPVEVLDAIASDGDALRPLRTALAATVAATGDAAAVGRVIVATLPGSPEAIGDWHFTTAATLLDALERRRLASGALDPDAAARLALLTKRARAIARGADGAKAAERVAALRLLGRDASSEMDVRIAGELLVPTEPPAVQAAAVAVLARSQHPAAPAALIAAVGRVSPALRTQVLDALTARPKSTEALLAAVESGSLSPAELPAATREKLLNHANEGLRGRALKTLASARPAARTAALEAFRPALTLKGDASKGRALFEKSCTACHRLGEIGTAVGPDLVALTDKSAGYLLTAIVDPNAAVEGRFAAYQLETTDGDTLVGLLAEENAAGITLLQAGGVRQTLARGDIKSLAGSKVSLMPEGLEQGLAPQDVADLIAFVQRPESK